MCLEGDQKNSEGFASISRVFYETIANDVTRGETVTLTSVFEDFSGTENIFNEPEAFNPGNATLSASLHLLGTKSSTKPKNH